jgi:hypothetical protein
MRFKTLIPALIMALCPSVSVAIAAETDSWTDSPKELGRVSWRKNLGKALEEAKTTGKPVLLLFQEIPG